jgi:hypothetical protein
MIKYRFAYNSDCSEIVSIDDVDANEKIFFCISCGKPLIARRGKKRQHHFAHAIATNTCNAETYLHILAKTVLYNDIQTKIEKNEKLEITLSVPLICKKCTAGGPDGCSAGRKNSTYNLLSRYQQIEMEKPDGNFIPDLMLIGKDKNDSIYLEIAVTHYCSEEKIKSGKRIIEFPIRTEEEATNITKVPLIYTGNSMNTKSIIPLNKSTDEKVDPIFYNFSIKKQEVDCSSPWKCLKPINFFIIYESGKVYHQVGQFKDYQKNKLAIQYCKEYKVGESVPIEADIIEAYNNGCQITNCHLCRYHGENKSRVIDELSIFCKIDRCTYYMDAAHDCEKYRIDPKCFGN